MPPSPEKTNSSSRAWRELGLTFAVALSLRLAFSFYFSQYYYGDIRYTFGDTESFTQAFLNLINKGVYSFDINSPDAYLYRPPVYPLFWGLHYLLFGAKHVFKSVAFSQSILDAGSSVLCILLAGRLGCSCKWAVFAGMLYAINPIFLVHVPISGTETLAIFLTLLSIYLALYPEKTSNLFWSALLLALATMTRQYLGIILPLCILYFCYRGLQSKPLGIAVFAKKSLVYLLSFCLFISPWFLRNTIELQRPTILMGPTTGYRAYQADYIAFRDFYSLYYVNITPIYTSIAIRGSDGLADENTFGDLAEAVSQAARLAHHCGPSFLAWRSLKGHGSTQSELIPPCQGEVVAAYTSLKNRALDRGGLALLLKAPTANVLKSLFKQELVHDQSSPTKAFMVRLIFGFRSAYILLALLSGVLLWKRPEVVFLLYPLAMIILISFGLRQVEIRYLVQAEALMIPYATLAMDRLSGLVRRVTTAA